MIYQALGLYFDSAMALPEFLRVDRPISDADPVTIRFGSVPDMLPDVRFAGPLYQISARQFALRIPGIAHFLVSDGKEIIVQPDAHMDEDSIRLFLLTSTLGALLHQRKILPVHGSCIETPYGAVILGGISGAGKSTLAAAFQHIGYRVLADNICALQPGHTGSPVVIPSYPQITLWRNALDELHYEDIEAFHRVRPKLNKYALPLGTDFCDQPLPLRAIYILSISKRYNFELNSIEGSIKLPVLNQVIYQVRFAIEMGVLPTYWKIFGSIARGVPVAELNHGINNFALEAMTEAILKDLSVTPVKRPP